MFRLAVNREHRENPWWELGGERLWQKLAGGSPAGSRPESATISEKQFHAFLTSAKRIEGWYTSSDIDDTPILIERVADK